MDRHRDSKQDCQATCLEAAAEGTVEEMKLNFNDQEYRGIKLRLIARKDYPHRDAKRFTLNDTRQNVWIPNKHLEADGTIKACDNLDYIFRKSQNQLSYAGYTGAIIGIKKSDANRKQEKHSVLNNTDNQEDLV